MARWWEDGAVRGMRAVDRAVGLVSAALFVAALVALFRHAEVVFWVCGGAAVLGQYATLHRDRP